MTREGWRMVFVCAMATVAGALGGAWSSSRVGAQAPVPVVTTTQVNIVDGQGRLRAVLAGEDGRGTTSLAFYDAGGQPRMRVAADVTGRPLIELLSEQGTPSVTIAQPGGTDGSIVVGDPQGSRVGVAINNGVPMINLGARNQTALLLQVADGMWPAVMLNAAQSQARLQITPDGSPSLTIYRDGRARATIGVVQKASVLNLSDEARPRLVAGVAENGRPSVNFLDEAGRLVRELP